MIKRKTTHLLWLLPSMVIIFLFTFFPFFKTIISSFINDDKLSIENFKLVLSDDNFLIALRNSLILSFGSVFTIIIGVWISLMVAKVINTFARDSLITIIFFQYMFITMAIYTGYTFIFQSDYGFINSLIINNGGKNINFLYSKHNAIWTILIIEIIKPISFVVAILSYRFVTYISDNLDILKSDCIKNDSFFLSKLMIKNSLSLILLLLFYLSAENLLSYPIGIYSNDISSMFTYHAQTLTAYINRALDLNSYGIASASSTILILIFSPTSFIIYILFKKGRNRNER